VARGNVLARILALPDARLIGWIILTITITCVGGTAVAVWPDQVLTLMLAAGVVSATTLLRRRLSPSILSPVYLAAIGYVLLALPGRGIYQWAKDKGASGAAARISLSHADIQNTTRLILVAAIAIVVGAALFTVAFPTRGKPAPRLHAIALSPRTQKLLLIAIAILLAIVMASFGWHDLMKRLIYLPISHRPLYSVAAELGTVATLGLGYLFAAGRGGQRILTQVLLICYGLVFFSISSRRLALLPLLFALGGLSSAPQSRYWKRLLPFSLVASIALIRVSLHTRSLSEHGFWPYLHSLPDIPAGGWESVMLNLLVGFGVIGKTAFEVPPLPMEDFIISINPVPGDLSGWYGIAGQHRLNRFMPFAALGELGNAGWLPLVGYCLTAGFVLAYLDWRMRTLLDRGQQLYGLALVGLAGLFVLFSTQYNLRSATRLLYYAVTLDVIIRIWLAAIGSSAASSGRRSGSSCLAQRAGRGTLADWTGGGPIGEQDLQLTKKLAQDQTDATRWGARAPPR
jgi:hypothetical protein